MLRYYVSITCAHISHGCGLPASSASRRVSSRAERSSQTTWQEISGTSSMETNCHVKRASSKSISHSGFYASCEPAFGGQELMAKANGCERASGLSCIEQGKAGFT